MKHLLCLFVNAGHRGRIKHTEVCQLLRQMSPPVGIGRKCPKIVAYKVRLALFSRKPLYAAPLGEMTWVNVVGIIVKALISPGGRGGACKLSGLPEGAYKRRERLT